MHARMQAKVRSINRTHIDFEQLTYPNFEARDMVLETVNDPNSPNIVRAGQQWPKLCQGDRAGQQLTSAEIRTNLTMCV